jgi:hypothetical protein
LVLIPTLACVDRAPQAAAEYHLHIDLGALLRADAEQR